MGAALPSQSLPIAGSPFDLDNQPAYQRWRAWKLEHLPTSAEEITVDVEDPRALSDPERAALCTRIETCSMALYRSKLAEEDKSIPRLLGAQLGLVRLDANWLADEDGISSIEVHRADAGRTRTLSTPQASQGRSSFIPYTDKAIRWHTDGYYHPLARTIRGMILHAVRPARSGGINTFLDHELAYIALRDRSSEHIRALMQPDAMTIPAREDDGGIARAAQSGPVFSVDAQDGSLHMRYTARTRSIEWKADEATRAAVAALEDLLNDGTPGLLRTRLEPGMGIVGHNVLHDRTGFDDDPARPRLIYRARFLDRVAMDGRGQPWRNG